jgi:hypothetical protein
MNLPFQVSRKIADSDGNITPEWQIIFDQLFSQLNINFSNEGLVVPNQIASNINLLINSSNFTLIGDSTNNLLKVNLNGVFKTITTS